MTRFEAVKRLLELQDSDDKECAHIYADEVLCDLLNTLGYQDVTREYEKIDKWYA